MLSITQAKTGRVLTLPLLPDVADALITYLRTARPATSSRYVFVRHRAPFDLTALRRVVISEAEVRP